jgi:tRNA A-37 threonylcarbamoyl transferase component Bud32/tetratricopeptide (TPR) repeat protein
MSTALRTHPHPDALRDFVLGHLPAEEARQLEEHIAACAECCANLSRCEADTDPLVCWLKQASPTTPPVSGPSEYLTRDANTSSRDSAEVLTPPNILGRYEILAELGKGGMGVVYKARDTQLKRLVAIKMMRNSTFDSEENRARFHAEGLAVARLRHPHIVQLLEVGEAEGSPYLVLEYLDGGSLSDNRKLAGPMDVMEAAALVQKLAEAIAHAHAEGVIHRDLKPANVLLTADGLAKITDFGLVKFDRQIVPGTLPLKETTTGFIVGTPHYMSPEQASGRPGVIGPATDIYALGAILYELLTDDPPFADLSNPIEVLQTIQEREPPSPRRFRPDLPRDLEVICMKCLRLEQHRRYLTASELAAELGRFLGGEPILARPLSWRQRAGRWCRRNPMVAGLLSGLAAVIVASLIGLTWLYLDADAQRQRAEQQERDARLFAQEAERKGKEALQQKAETDRQRQEALDYFSIARQAIEAFQTRVINDTKLREHDFRPLRSTLLESSLRFHEALVRHRTDNPQLQMFQGYAYVQLGALREELGQNNEALAAYGKGIDTYLNLAGQSSQREMAHKHVVDVWVRRSVLLKRLGQFPKALADLKAAIAVQEELSATYP